jgi:hypothetical protein
MVPARVTFVFLLEFLTLDLAGNKGCMKWLNQKVMNVGEFKI